MRVFMLGWEFPPFISGGLGTACYGLTKAMSALGTDVLFVLPRPVSTPFSTHVSLISPQAGSSLAGATTEFRLDEFENVTFRTVDAQNRDSTVVKTSWAIDVTMAIPSGFSPTVTVEVTDRAEVSITETLLSLTSAT